MAIRPICPSAQQCANRDARTTVLESELNRLRELDGIREDFANYLKGEIELLQAELRAVSETDGFDRFRQVKIAISKALHPNNFAGDPTAQKIRGDIFKEIWPQIERIERG